MISLKNSQPLLIVCLFCGVGFLSGLWLGEHQESLEEKSIKRFQWELKTKLSLDQALLAGEKNDPQ